MRQFSPLRLSAAIFFAALALAVATASFAADEPKSDAKKDAVKPELKIIKPEEAKDHEGEVVTVEFKVVGAKEADSGVCFLNSSTKRDDPKGFTAFITNKGLKKFKDDPKTEKPAELYKSKTVRVSGAIKKFKETLEIEVNDPSQITIVEVKKEEKKEDKKS